MNKQIALLLFLLTFGFPVAQERKPSIHEADLINGKFSSSGLIFQLQIIFSKDKRYSTTYASEGIYWYNAGKFDIKGDTIFLEPDQCKDSDRGATIPCENTLGRAKCRVTAPNDDFEFLEKIVCTSETNHHLLTSDAENSEAFYFNTTKPVPEGSIRKYGTIDIYTINRYGVTTDNVKIRESPSMSGKPITFIPQLFAEANRPSVPTGTRLRIIGRTLTRDRVQKWQNYWYLVNVGAHEKVWMFGEFVRIDGK